MDILQSQEFQEFSEVAREWTAVRREAEETKDISKLGVWLENHPDVLEKGVFRRQIFDMGLESVKTLMSMGVMKQDDQATFEAKRENQSQVGWEHSAAKEGRADILRLMREEGWNMDRGSVRPIGNEPESLRPMTYAILSGNRDAVREVFIGGGRTDSKNDTMMEAIARTGNTAMLQDAKLYGAKMDLQTMQEALMSSVRSDVAGPDMVGALIDMGAQMHLTALNYRGHPGRVEDLAVVQAAARSPEKFEVFLQKNINFDDISGAKEAVTLRGLPQSLEKMRAYGEFKDTAQDEKLAEKMATSFSNLSVSSRLSQEDEGLLKKNEEAKSRLAQGLVSLYKAGVSFEGAEMALVGRASEIRPYFQEAGEEELVRRLDASVAYSTLNSKQMMRFTDNMDLRLEAAVTDYRNNPGLVNVPTFANRTAMHAASLVGGRAVELVHEMGGDVNTSTPQGLKPVYMAAFALKTDSLEALHRLGADCNTKSFEYKQPIHFVMRSKLSGRTTTPEEANKMFDTFEMLTGFGNDPSRRAKDTSKSPLEDASKFINEMPYPKAKEALRDRWDKVYQQSNDKRQDRIREQLLVEQGVTPKPAPTSRKEAASR